VRKLALSYGFGTAAFAAKRARAKPVRSYQAGSAIARPVRTAVLRIPVRMSPASG